ncbi:hypothetical protein CYLTODRAFT_100572 [Cylindrobasidium torrendii FP15055 ss-10]|uniref:Zn(2)-C6 fungal-type domain-containing protein n=1 Tax=Cylindrobasidium torrendii FP15055 ss-10 TaxID=1314674 RepID=A0A0D7B4P9_9AGAR|nr:hypothetical protein CYLTODRAFT_100572 [Cylindrobasidium torrendii FP15055 ss-10]
MFVNFSSNNPERFKVSSPNEKRQKRASMACTNCRNRKIRCQQNIEEDASGNKVLKPCQRCVRRQLECEYTAIGSESPELGWTPPVPSPALGRSSTPVTSTSAPLPSRSTPNTHPTTSTYQHTYTETNVLPASGGVSRRSAQQQQHRRASSSHDPFQSTGVPQHALDPFYLEQDFFATHGQVPSNGMGAPASWPQPDGRGTLGQTGVWDGRDVAGAYSYQSQGYTPTGMGGASGYDLQQQFVSNTTSSQQEQWQMMQAYQNYQWQQQRGGM